MISMASRNSWIRQFSRSDARIGSTLLCFPHAGGSAGFYRPLAAAAPDVGTVLAVQYPGRQDRRTEAPCRSIDEIADRTVQSLRDTARLALFGHSMGSVVAFEVARRLEHSGTPPVAVFVSGRCAPSRTRHGKQLHQSTDAELVAVLQSWGGTEAALLDNEDWLAMILPAVRADCAVVERHRFAEPACIKAPVVALTGTADPQVAKVEVEAWSQHTTGQFSLHELPGGHFFLAEQWPGVAAIIAEALRAHG